MASHRLDSLALRGARLLARFALRLGASRLEQPRFLVCCGRSGSSLLRRLPSRHPQLGVLPSEANELWHPQLYPWTATDRAVPPLWLEPHRFTSETGPRPQGPGRSGESSAGKSRAPGLLTVADEGTAGEGL